MMKSQIKLLCVALIVILSISLCTLHVFATPDADPLTNETTVTTSTEAPVPVETDPPTDPITEPPTEATTTPTTAATTAPTTAATQATTAATTAPPVATTTPQATTPVYNDDPVEEYPSAVYEDDNTDITPQSSLYDTDGKRVDTDTLKKNDWKEIAEMLQNADGNSDAQDFSFIQNNTGDGDNGLWILITGISLIAVGVGIVVFVIVFEVRKKKNLKNNKHGKNGKNPPSDSNNGNRHVEAKKPLTSAEKKQINRRSKFDTAEVFVPRRTPAKGKRAYSGTRYKPKH